MMKTDSVYYDDYLNEKLKDPKFKASYDALEAEYNIQLALMKAQIDNGLTSEQIAERAGVNQSEIEALENGGANPTLDTLQRLAAGMGMRLRLDFQPATA